MSVWTHVAAVFRFDGLLERKTDESFDKEVGRTIHKVHHLDDSYELAKNSRDWEAYDKNPELFVPTGSEGSLRKLVWINPNPSDATRYTVTVYGDLRDYEDENKIKEWFDRSCHNAIIRQAVCHCMVEGKGEWTWSHSWADIEYDFGDDE